MRLRSANRLGAYLIFAAMFLSGASALVYEISWSRQLGILFGHTSRTASIVLATYFFGMAIGYALAAKFVAGSQNPLRCYALLEVFAAAWACCVPIAVSALAGVESTGTATTAAMLLLLPPTAALGATLPFVAEHFSRAEPNLSMRLTTAYAWNTVGAVFGVVLTTFWLISFAGVAGSSLVGAVNAALVGLVIWRFASVQGATSQSVLPQSQKPSRKKQATPKPARVAQRADKDGLSSPAPWLVLTMVGVSGAVTLGLQTLYTHLFSLVLHNSTYTFGTIIATFLIALAASSAVCRHLLRWFSAAAIAGFSCAASAAAVAISPGAFLRLTELKYFKAGDNLLEHLLQLAWLTTQVIAPSILSIGLVLPALWFAVRGTSAEGRTVGTLTAVNTVMAALGALAMSHLVLPWIGIWGAFSLVSSVLLSAACLCVWATDRKLVSVGMALLLLPLILQSHQGGIPRAVPKGGELVRRWETAYGWVDLIRRRFDGAMLMRQNIHYGLGSNLDATWEKRQGHLPLLLHSAPKSVCFLGLGTGLSAASAVEHPELTAVTAVELIPEVVEASRLYPETASFHKDDRVAITAADASHFLKGRQREFDVVVGDLFTPFHSHTGYLYTVEHFRQVRRSLRPGGMFCQWLALWQVGPKEFEIIADSFGSVFPHATLWWGRLEYGQSMIALVGTDEPLHVEVVQLERRLQALQSQSHHPDPFLASPRRIQHLYAGVWNVVDARRLNTNERPRVEFSAPRSYTSSFQLREDRLLQYWDTTLSRLSMAAPFVGHDDEPALRESLAQWQRYTLTRRVTRGRGPVAAPNFLD